MNLQRMIVVPAHTFEKWKNILIHNTRITDLKVKSILNNKKLNDISKWQLYKQIFCHSEIQRRTKMESLLINHR